MHTSLGGQHRPPSRCAHGATVVSQALAHPRRVAAVCRQQRRAMACIIMWRRHVGRHRNVTAALPNPALCVLVPLPTSIT